MPVSYMPRRSGSVLLAFALGLSASLPGLARDQWSTNHGGNNPPLDQRFMPGGTHSGYVPSVGAADFWKGQLNSRIPAGTVLTAILEDNLSSAKNKQGDTFALTLEDGFANGGRVLVPPKSKIIGTVMHVESSNIKRNGHPGTMEVSLQTLVLPDGSHYPLFAFIDGNPGSKHKKPPKVKNLGVSIADYGQSLAGMAASFVTGPGFMMKKLNRGNEFELDKGDAVPIRLTRSVDIKPSLVPNGTATATSLSGMPKANNVQGIPTAPPIFTRGNAAAVPGLIDPTGPIQIPGFVPGLAPQNGAPSAVSAPYSPMTAPNMAPANDPNDVFNRPVAPHTLNDLPDPF